MSLNSIMYYLIFYGLGVTHSLLAIDSEKWCWDASLDYCLEDIVQQDNSFMRENTGIVQRARAWIASLDETVRGIDHDCRQLNADMQRATDVHYKYKDMLEQQQKIGATWAMLCHTKREIECFIALLKAYTALHEPEKNDYRWGKEEHWPIKHYIGMLNAVFGVQQNQEEVRFLQEAAFLDKAEYALTRTRDVVKSCSVFRKQAFHQMLREKLEPYGYAPRSSGAYVCNRNGYNSKREEVCSYLYAMMDNVFELQRSAPTSSSMI